MRQRRTQTKAVPNEDSEGEYMDLAEDIPAGSPHTSHGNPTVGYPTVTRCSGRYEGEVSYDRDALDQHQDIQLTETIRDSGNTEMSKRKRRRVQTSNQRHAANMRERRRMCHLNEAFTHLKDHLPNVRERSRMSRIQTLRAAITYIQCLSVEQDRML